MHNPFSKLVGGSWRTEGPTTEGPKLKERQTDIDRFCRELLLEQPELQKAIETVFAQMESQQIPLPLMHVTSSRFEGSSTDGMPSFVDHIRQRGFRARDTNVAALMDRRVNPPIVSDAARFAVAPSAFVKEIILVLQRYLHHGVRANKAVLGTQRDRVVGVPVLLLVEGGVGLERGSDYDNHFRLTEAWSGEHVFGVVDLSRMSSYQDPAFIPVLQKIVAAVQRRYLVSDSHGESSNA